jgi:hypothetical protein
MHMYDAEDCSTQMTANDTTASLPRSSNASALNNMRPRGKGSPGDDDSNRLVLVLNKRWLFLLGSILCLVVGAVVAGVAYFALDKGNGDGKKSSSNNNNNGSNNFNRPPPPRDNSNRNLLRGVMD